MGLANIKNTAKKYQGTMDFRVKDSVFILSVMMKNEKAIKRRTGGRLWQLQELEAITRMVYKRIHMLQGKRDSRGHGNKGYCVCTGEEYKRCQEQSGFGLFFVFALKRIPELEKQGYEQLCAQNKALGDTVTYYQQTWMINSDGSI